MCACEKVIKMCGEFKYNYDVKIYVYFVAPWQKI